MSAPKKVLITGAYGLIGNAVYRKLIQTPDLYDVHALARRRQPSARLPGTETVEIADAKLQIANMADFAAVQKAVQGMDVVVHMAADPRGEAEWESVQQNNIIGGYHMFEASRLAGVKRVIYASSGQVIWGYRDTEPYASLDASRYDGLSPADIPRIRHDQPARPVNLYGSSKVWGEALAQVYAYAHGLSCIVLRIGGVVAGEPPQDPTYRHMWCSRRDIVQLVERSINAPDSLRFDIFFGLSGNAYNVADIQHARDVLGYAPQDGFS